MVAGRPIWIAIWYVILLVGILGFWGSLYWGRQTHWRNLDELLRAGGTVSVSAGMLLVLYGVGGWAGESLLLAALLCFIFAFLFGRKRPPADPHARHRAAEDEPDDEPPLGRA